jgi:thiamine-phosphate pyrophosphorylase
MLDQFTTPPGPANLPKAWFMTDPRCEDPVCTVRNLPLDCGVIIRHYEHPDRPQLISEIMKNAKETKRRVLIAGSPDIAKDRGAAGVHWPRWANIKPIPSPLLSVHAVHNEAELERAHAHKADAIIISPLFPTQSHQGRNSLGIEKLEELLNKTSLPAYVMGGITLDRLRSINHLNITGFAGIGCFEGRA